MRGFFIRAPFPVIALFDARVQWFADVLASLGDTDDRDARRVKAIAILANPHVAVALPRRSSSGEAGPTLRPTT